MQSAMIRTSPSIATFMACRVPPITALILPLGLLICLVPPNEARAQESRTAEIEAQQAEKAAHLSPPAQTRPERVLEKVQGYLTGPPVGLIPEFGSIYSGGGFTLGAGYQRFIGDQTTWVARGFYSIRNYKLFDIAVNSPGHAHGRVDYTVKAGWRDATRVGYYGLGQSSKEEDRANFRFNETFAGGEVRARAPGYLFAGGSVYYQDFRERSGEGSAPSIEDEVHAVTAPGLGYQSDVFHSIVFGGLDWRPSPGTRALAASTKCGTTTWRGGSHADLRSPRHRGHSAHSHPSRDMGPVAARPYADHARRRCAVFPDAVPRQRIDVACLSLAYGSATCMVCCCRANGGGSPIVSGWMSRSSTMRARSPLNGSISISMAWRTMSASASVCIAGGTPLRIEVAKGSDGWNIVWSGSHAF